MSVNSCFVRMIPFPLLMTPSAIGHALGRATGHLPLRDIVALAEQDDRVSWRRERHERSGATIVGRGRLMSCTFHWPFGCIGVSS